MATNPRATCPRCWWCGPSKHPGHVCLSRQPSGPFLLSGRWGAWASTQNRHSVAVTIKRHLNPSSKRHMPRGACQAGGLVNLNACQGLPCSPPVNAAQATGPEKPLLSPAISRHKGAPAVPRKTLCTLWAWPQMEPWGHSTAATSGCGSPHSAGSRQVRKTMKQEAKLRGGPHFVQMKPGSKFTSSKQTNVSDTHKCTYLLEH